MKRLVSIITTICAFMLIARGEVNSHKVEVFIEANAPLKILTKGEGTYASKATWRKESADNYISATMTAVSDQWKEIKFSFLPSQDGKLKINLRSNFFRDKNGSVIDNTSMFKNLKMNGKPLASDLLKSKNGTFATYSKKITTNINVKKNEKIEISALAKVPNDEDGNYFIDISNIANSVASKELQVPISFTKGYQKLNNITFNFLDSDKILHPIKSNTGVATIDIKSEDTYQYLYVIANVGDGIDYNNRACGHLDIFYKNGKLTQLWIRKDRDFLSSHDKDDYTVRGIRINLNGSTKDGGSAYMVQFPLSGDSAIDRIEAFGDVNFFAMTLTNKDVSTIKAIDFDMSEWKPVDMSNLTIADGSALDVSEGIGETNAGRYGYVRVGKSGHFEFEKMPNKKVKFKGTNWRPGDMFGKAITTHEQIDELAKMARKQGYNLIRWRLSMRKDEFKAPYQLKNYNKDLYDYFLYAFAREGIYHHLNLSSHDLGDPSFEWEDRFSVKVLMFFGEKKTRESWRKLMHYQLNLVNKYTGKKWKDDPSIVSTEYYNEIELGPSDLNKSNKRVKAFVDAKFVDFLKSRYNSLDELKSAYPTTFKNVKNFEDIKASAIKSDNPEYAQFIVFYGRQMQEFCENVIRNEIGFKAPLHQHNCARTTAWALLSAEAGDYTALNVYHHHPSGFMKKGSYVANTSSVSDFGSYFLAAASKRVANRPMMLTEWQHCYWNPLTHEGGVLFPAYAAFQGFDNLTIHDAAIVKKAKRLGCFEVGQSPVYRANEFLSYAMFYRGDVATSRNRVDVVYDKHYLETSPYLNKAMNREQSKVALLTGFAIDFPDARKTPMVKDIKGKSAILKMKPNGYSETWSAANFTSTGNGTGEYKISETIDVLRQKGILHKDNITDSDNGVFQTDTGEITMRVKEKLVKVVTPKTEAITLFPKTKNEKLGRATLISTSVPSAFAVVSIDNKPISQSKRMVIVFNTDNIMTGFKTAIGREILFEAGELPILMQTGRLVAKLKLPEENHSIISRFLGIFKKQESPKQYNLYALKINGERMQKLPLKIENGELILDIDTSKMNETTPFFELVAE